MSKSARRKGITKKQKIVMALVVAIFLIGLIGTCVSSEGLALGADDMPVGEIVEARDQYSKTYYMGDGQYRIEISSGSIHYNDGYGDWQEIDTAIVPSTRPNWDYEVVKGHWHLLINNDTSVAIGKDGNWIGFKYAGFGYLDWATKDYHILQTTQSVTPVVDHNRIVWPDIFYGVDLEYIYTPDGFKENLYVTQTARDWLEANPPSSFGLDNSSTYFVGFIECDWRLSLPARDMLGAAINWDNVNEFINSGVYWYDPLLDKIATVLPVGYAIHDEIEPLDYVKLRYRFYQHTNGSYYLLFGANVLDLNSYPDGTIVLDPTLTVQGTGKDNYICGAFLQWDVNYGSNDDIKIGYSNDANIATLRGLIEFPIDWGVDIPDGVTIDSAILNLYVHTYTGNSDTFTAARLLRLDWAELQSSWVDYKTGSTWAVVGCDSSVSDYTTANQVGITISSTGWKSWTITNQVQTAQTGSINVAFRIAGSTTSGTINKYFSVYSKEYTGDTAKRPKLVIDYTLPIYPPTVVTSAATNIEDTTATLNGEVTDTGGENPTVTVYWGDEDGETTPEIWDNSSEPTSPAQPQGAAMFYKDTTALPTGTTIYFTARGVNGGGTGWGSTRSFLTKPAAPTDIDATDDLSDKITLTWTKATGATGYYIYRDGGLLDTVGDVATYDDETAAAPEITAGSTIASDGTSTEHVALSLSGTSVEDGTEYDYKLKAFNAAGNSDDSDTDSGYRKAGALNYQWQRSAADSDANYSNIIGAIGSTYDDTEAPAGTITSGSTIASDGSSTAHVALSLSGTSTSEGDGRYYQCVLNAAGADQQISTSDRGYRTIGSLEYQWQRSAADSDADYSNITGATMAAHNDTAAPAPTITAGNATASDGTSGEYVILDLSGHSGNNGAGRYYQCVLNATGAASSEISTSDRGYRSASALYYQWYKSFSDAASNYSAISGATSVPYNDTGGVLDPDGRYYLCALNMTDAVSQNSTADRGYMRTLVAPDITSHDATAVTDSATLQGEILDTGGASVTTVGFEWGISTGNYTYSWNSTGVYGVGLFNRTITGLQAITTYYWRAYGTNVAGTNYSTERSFTTLDVPFAPTDFTITQVGIESITISWIRGTSADTTIIVVNESGYPDDIADGYIVYNGNGISVTLSGLWFDTTTYYYRAWSLNDYGYSLDYAEASIGNPISVASIMFVIALCGFALWKKSWIRIILAIAIMIWAAFTLKFDPKIAAPLLVIGVILFVSDIFKVWRSHKERQAPAEILTRDEVIY